MTAMNFRNILEPEHWGINMEKTIHAYNDEETPMQVVLVHQGWWVRDNGSTPILTWMTEKELNEWLMNY